MNLVKLTCGLDQMNVRVSGLETQTKVKDLEAPLADAEHDVARLQVGVDNVLTLEQSQGAEDDINEILETKISSWTYFRMSRLNFWTHHGDNPDRFTLAIKSRTL